MKRIGLLIITLSALPAVPAVASTDIMVPAAMQRCMSNEECTMVSNACASTCATLPVNKGNIAAIDALKSQRCGSVTPPENQVCNTNPPMESTCINNRCTVGYAFKHHADPQDYKPGAYPVPEKAASPAPESQSYNSVNDRDGNFSAYNMPQETVRQNIMGQYKLQNPNAQAGAETETSIQ